MSGAVVLGAWVLALGAVAAPLAGLPEPDLDASAVDRFGLVACFALVAASAPCTRPRTGLVLSVGAATVARIALFLPLAAVAAQLDAQAGRGRTPLSAALVLVFAAAFAWSAERARRDPRRGARYALAWALLVGLPAIAASLFAASVPLGWSPLVWCLEPRAPELALGPAAVVALVVGLVVGLGAGRSSPREA